MSENIPVDHVIVSANENWLYLDFWPFVAWAYRTLFPGVRVTLAFVSERRESDPFVAQLRRHGDVVPLRPLRDMPQAAQAKMARYFVAAEQGDRVCYIDDIDWIPIRREWYIGKVMERRPGTLLLVGPEVYGCDENGQAPASMMTGEGRVFRALFNPGGLPWDAYLRSLGGRLGRHQDIYSRVQNEGMMCTTDCHRLGGALFSDEALTVQLRRERPVPVTVIKRGYDPATDTIDRSWWHALDAGKLNAGGYLGAHTGRPYLEHKDGNDAIWSYIAHRYGDRSIPKPLHREPGVDPDMEFGGSAFAREAFDWICRNVPVSESILEVGSGHVSTNYLSRYYEIRSVERRLELVNIYPSHYIYAPATRGYDPELLRFGFDCYNPYRKIGLLLVNDPACIDVLDCLPRAPRIMVPQEIAEAVAAWAGRPVKQHGSMAVV